jgi:hypothetical protein
MSHTGTGSSPANGPVRRTARWWMAAGTFVVGLLAGVVLAGLLIRNAPEPAEAQEGPVMSTGDTTSPTATGTNPPGAEVEIVVNEACLRAVNAAQDAYNAIERIAGAITDLNFSELDGIVRDLQPIQQALQADVSACQMSARLPDGSMMTTSVQPTASGEPSEPSEPATTTSPPTPTAPTTR